MKTNREIEAYRAGIYFMIEQNLIHTGISVDTICEHDKTNMDFQVNRWVSDFKHYPVQSSEITVGSPVLLYDRYRFTSIPQKATVIRMVQGAHPGVEVRFTECTNSPSKYPISSTTIVCMEQLRLDDTIK